MKGGNLLYYLDNPEKLLEEFKSYNVLLKENKNLALRILFYSTMQGEIYREYKYNKMLYYKIYKEKKNSINAECEKIKYKIYEINKDLEDGYDPEEIVHGTYAKGITREYYLTLHENKLVEFETRLSDLEYNKQQKDNIGNKYKEIIEILLSMHPDSIIPDIIFDHTISDEIPRIFFKKSLIMTAITGGHNDTANLIINKGIKEFQKEFILLLYTIYKNIDNIDYGKNYEPIFKLIKDILSNVSITNEDIQKLISETQQLKGKSENTKDTRLYEIIEEFLGQSKILK
jgi:hypothetical protein